MKTKLILLVFIFLSIYIHSQNRIEPNNAIKLELPKKDEIKNYKIINVSIDSLNIFRINGIKIDKNRLETELVRQFLKYKNKKILIKLDKKTLMKNAVYVMDIANRNRIKSSLAVRTK